MNYKKASIRCFFDIEKDLPKDWTQEQIEHWRLGFYAQEARIREIQRNIEDFFNESGEKSAEYIKEALPEYYNFSRQATIDNIQAKANISFSLLNKNAIKAIINENLPVFSKIAYKNLGQNRKACNMLRNEILQATLLGESQDKLAKRIKRVAGYQYNYQAKRTAQTERTRVQSEASYRTGKEAQALGLNITKRWSATMVRTRDTHAELNGKVIPIDDDFELSDGDKLCYPGDPKGRACNIINCRCDVIYEVDTNHEKEKFIKNVEREDFYFENKKVKESKKLQSKQISENLSKFEYIQTIKPSKFKFVRTTKHGRYFESRPTHKEKIAQKVKFNKEIKQILEKNFGTFVSDDIVLTEERDKHIHKDAKEFFDKNLISILTDPDGVIHNKEKVYLVIFYKIIDTKYQINVPVRLPIKNTWYKKGYITTGHILKNKDMERMQKKYKIYYKK